MAQVFVGLEPLLELCEACRIGILKLCVFLNFILDTFMVLSNCKALASKGIKKKEKK